MPMRYHLILFFKEPVTGEVKTRLGKTIGMQKARLIYEFLLKRHLQLIEDLAEIYEPYYYIGKSPSRRFRKKFESQWGKIHAQKGADLGERMHDAFGQVWRLNPRPTLLLGSDTASLSLENLLRAKRCLFEKDAVIGPSEDGGYWCIGFSKPPTPALFKGIAWSSNAVFEKQVKNFHEENYTYAELDTLGDVDEEEDIAKMSLK